MITKHRAGCISVVIAQAPIPMRTDIWDTVTTTLFPLAFIPMVVATDTEDMNPRDFQAELFHVAVLATQEFVWEAEP